MLSALRRADRLRRTGPPESRSVDGFSAGIGDGFEPGRRRRFMTGLEEWLQATGDLGRFLKPVSRFLRHHLCDQSRELLGHFRAHEIERLRFCRSVSLRTS